MVNSPSRAASDKSESASQKADPFIVPAPVVDVADVLLDAQAASLGVDTSQILDAELAQGAKYHPAVSTRQIEAIAEQYHQAQHRLAIAVKKRRDEPAVRVLCAPTSRTVDLIVDEQAITAMGSKLLAQGAKEALITAMDVGPSGNRVVWDKPESPVELVASILRWAMLRGEEKKRLRVSDSLRKWVAQALNEAGISPLEKLGGASAISAALAPVLGRTPTMMALGKLPPDILHHISSQTRVIGDDPAINELGELPLDQDSTGNFCISFKGRPLQMPEPLQNLKINGELRRCAEITWVELFITGSSQVPGFNGMPDQRLMQIGAEHGLAILTGMQYLTSVAEINKYFDAVDLMHRAGARTALLYSESKAPELENDKWLAIKRRRAIDFFGMNTTESFDILERIYESAKGQNALGVSSDQLNRIGVALAQASGEDSIWGSAKESPIWLFECAKLLQELLEIPVVRVRAKALDIVVTAAELKHSSADHTRDSIIVSRNMGTLKVANISGVLDEVHELEMLRNSPHGLYLAALHVMADRAAASNETEAAELPYRCYMTLRDGRRFFAVPPIPFFSRRGSTQSAGDTIDFTFASEEMDALLKEARELNLA